MLRDGVSILTTKQTHISQIRSGNTIIHEGKIVEVSDKDIRVGGFLGTSIFGDSYHSGYKKVTLVTFLVF